MALDPTKDASDPAGKDQSRTALNPFREPKSPSRSPYLLRTCKDDGRTGQGVLILGDPRVLRTEIGGALSGLGIQEGRR